MTIFFLLLAAIAFIGFGIQAARKNGHGMVYSAIICLFWIVAALYWSGRIA